MIDEPLVHASGSTTKPNSTVDQSTSSEPSRDRWVRQVDAAPRKSRTKSRLETASIEFGATRGEAERVGDRAAVGVEVHARQRARAERQDVGLRRRRSAKPRAVALEHPDVREQVVRQVDRLAALQVRVAGQRPVEVLLGLRRRARA